MHWNICRSLYRILMLGKFCRKPGFYKQGDLVIWCVPLEEKDKFLHVYPDCDVQINIYNERDNNTVWFSFEGEKIEKKYRD